MKSWDLWHGEDAAIAAWNDYDVDFERIGSGITLSNRLLIGARKGFGENERRSEESEGQG